MSGDRCGMGGYIHNNVGDILPGGPWFSADATYRPASLDSHKETKVSGLSKDSMNQIPSFFRSTRISLPVQSSLLLSIQSFIRRLSSPIGSSSGPCHHAGSLAHQLSSKYCGKRKYLLSAGCPTRSIGTFNLRTGHGYLIFRL